MTRENYGFRDTKIVEVYGRKTLMTLGEVWSDGETYIGAYTADSEHAEIEWELEEVRADEVYHKIVGADGKKPLSEVTEAYELLWDSESDAPGITE